MVTVSDNASKDGNSLFENSALYKEFLAEREEILKHKWIESEKAGFDVGFEKALLDWIVNHRATWRSSRQKSAHPRNSDGHNIHLNAALVLGIVSTIAGIEFVIC